MQLERVLQSQGFGSRKICRSLIREGRVVVAGNPAEDPCMEVSPEGLVFVVDGEKWQYRKQVYLMLNKPAGFECSRSPRHHPSVLSLLPESLQQRGVQPVGRLDEDTTGLLLLSDDGNFIHRLISPRYKVVKVYDVTTKHAVSEAQIHALQGGVMLHDAAEPVLAVNCVQTGAHRLLLSLAEGRYHQVKRMLGAVGNRVVALRRVQVGNLELPPDLPEGQWCWLDNVALSRLAQDNG